jgi:hypothetical protein
MRANKTFSVLIALGATGFVFSTAASGAFIDFETVPGGTAADGLGIHDQYAAPVDGGVTFFYDGNQDGQPDMAQGGGFIPMHLESVGETDGAPHGYVFDQVSGAPKDVEHPDFAGGLGDYFLRGPAEVSDRGPFDMIVRYTNPTMALSGEIWDVDGINSGKSEQWSVQIFGTAGDDSSLLATINSPLGIINNASSLDGKPWMFSWAAPQGVTAEEVRFVFTGGKTSGVGLAFDNFNSTVVPEPTGLILLAFGAAALLRRKR